jgi:uracil-DNA glycosylase
MVEMQEREQLLGSLKGYLEDLLESGADELFFVEGAPCAPAVNGAPAETVEPLAEQQITETGNPRARLLFVLTGAGFAGPSGELFAKIVKAMGFAREQVLLLSFPPESSVVDLKLRSSLLNRIAVVDPAAAVALGEAAAQLLLQSGDSIFDLRGHFHDLQGVPLMATLHPDQLLADETLKREVWNEMQQVMRKLAARG